MSSDVILPLSSVRPVVDRPVVRRVHHSWRGDVLAASSSWMTSTGKAESSRDAKTSLAMQMVRLPLR